ncbi:hypothetical protein QM806_04610 [Rhodococcus sp. IEGM 1351]|uniref:hypothetical protein n=1 Tax=Rhodococcus sp. IEGM 1351 TaxID=3047089 RepID=UPI0024B862A0|nr:hypothetical protein [Rhodococcus sp. IEGM 1351]MDI9934737.1 hypothetical protein [Rhodococcus sp. IEGM 1351]
MSSNSSSSTSSGIGFVGVLTIVFIVLKLVPGNAVNDWSWWWVLSPIWISWLVVIAVVVLIGVAVGIYKLVKWATR